MKLIQTSSGEHMKDMKVDDEDFEGLSKFRWHWEKNHRKFYAFRNERVDGKNRKIKAHRQIMGLGWKDPRHVDHSNGDSMDCQKANMTVTSPQNNRRNSGIKTGHTCKGVFKHGDGKKRRCPFYASIGIAPGKKKYLGSFRTRKETAAAYNKAALEFFGKFAFLNDLDAITD